MTKLFSDQGLERLQRVLGPRTLCAFDFDGTLSPIVPDPDAARLPADIKERLEALARHAPIAIVTGRSLADIGARVGFAPDFIIGNHGIEGLPGWELRAAGFRQDCLSWRRQLETMLADEPGLVLEDKAYSLSVHYRTAPDPDAAAERLQIRFALLQPAPRVVAGKFVFNLVPEHAPHKGDAVEALIAQCGAGGAIFAGDDVTDEDVFRLERADLLSVRVEPLASSAAAVHLDSQQQMRELLDELTRRLRDCGARNWVRDAGA